MSTIELPWGHTAEIVQKEPVCVVRAAPSERPLFNQLRGTSAIREAVQAMRERSIQIIVQAVPDKFELVDLSYYVERHQVYGTDFVRGEQFNNGNPAAEQIYSFQWETTTRTAILFDDAHLYHRVLRPDGSVEFNWHRDKPDDDSLTSIVRLDEPKKLIALHTLY